MKFEILTIFPDFFRGPLDYGIVSRAREAGLIEIAVHDLRTFTHDRHRTVDDRPFGGGEGMVLKPEPIFECLDLHGISSHEDRLRGEASETVVLLSPQGKLFTQSLAQRMMQCERVVLICGRYEGVDERVSEHLADCAAVPESRRSCHSRPGRMPRRLLRPPGTPPDPGGCCSDGTWHSAP